MKREERKSKGLHKVNLNLTEEVYLMLKNDIGWYNAGKVVDGLIRKYVHDKTEEVDDDDMEQKR